EEAINLPPELSNTQLVAVAVALLVNSTLTSVANGAERFRCVAKSAGVQFTVLAGSCVVAVALKSLPLLIVGLVVSYIAPSWYLAHQLRGLPRELDIGWQGIT